MLIEYPDAHERKRELARLIGVEDRLFVEVEGHARVYAIADEDLDRENDEKTSAVHFVRFEFPAAARAAVRAGADFVKTSTGFGGGGATLEDVALMRATVGPDLGVKASGGVRSLETARAMISAGATRLGSSSGVAIVEGEQGTEGY